MIGSRLKHSWDEELRENSVNIVIWLTVFLLAGYFLFYSGSAFAVDQLAGVMDEVKANFGKDSTAVKLLYGAEIIAGGYMWHKTKNPMAVTGVVILSLFMNYALGKWIG
jgi:type IV conjugative transfer system pilin TraA